MNNKFTWAILLFVTCTLSLGFAPNQEEQCCMDFLNKQPTSSQCSQERFTHAYCESVVKNFSNAAQSQFHGRSKPPLNSIQQKKEVRPEVAGQGPGKTFSSRGDAWQLTKIFGIVIMALIFVSAVFKFSMLSRIVTIIFAFVASLGLAVVILLIFTKVFYLFANSNWTGSLAMLVPLIIGGLIGVCVSGFYFFRAVRRPDSIIRYTVILVSFQVLFSVIVFYFKLSIP